MKVALQTTIGGSVTGKAAVVKVWTKIIGGIMARTAKKKKEKKMGLFRALITNNSGLSSKSFFLVSVTVIGMILLMVPAFVLIMEVVFTHTIATDLAGMAAYIGAVAGLFATAGITKAWSERFEKKRRNIDDSAEDSED